MNTPQDIVATILTSAVVSSMVSFLLRVIFENRQTHRYNLDIEKLRSSYDIRLEKLKTDLALQADLQRSIYERRFGNYPQLAELVYRTRNLSREIFLKKASSVIVSEFQARATELEGALYQFRIDLQRDGLFLDIHGYKNLLKLFERAASDAGLLSAENSSLPDVEEPPQGLQSIFQDIELSHKAIIDKLSSKTARWSE